MQLAHRLIGVHRQVFNRATALRPDDVGTPTVVGKAAGDARRKCKCSVTPQKVAVARRNVFLVVEFLRWNGVSAIWQAQQKVRQRQANITRVFGLAESIPLDELWAFKNRRQVFQVRQLVIRIHTKELRRSGGNKRCMAHRRHAGDILQQLHVLTAGPKLVVANHRAKRLTTKLAIFSRVQVFVQA